MKSQLVLVALFASSLLATACTSEAKATARSAPNPPPALPAPSAQESDAGACAKICSQTSDLGCGAEAACLAACVEMRESGACSTEIGAFLACASARQSADWECGDNAMPALKDGVCNAEQGAIASCVEQLAKQAQ